MLSLQSAAVASLLFASSFAAPALQKRWDECLCRDEAQQIATNYGLLISSYSDELANAVLSPSFTDYSESVNTLIDSCPQGSNALPLSLTGPTFSSLAQFEAGQGQQAPINFQQLSLWYTCDTVMMRWITTNTTDIPNTKPVVGLITLLVNPSPAGSQFPYLINTAYSEFDSGAWLQNLQAAGICSSGTPLPNPTLPAAAVTTPAPTAATPYTTEYITSTYASAYTTYTTTY